MPMAQAFLGEFEQEAKITRKFLERVPEEKLGWKPHEKSHTAGELALHIATVPGGIVRIAQEEQSNLPDFSKPWPAPKDVKQILAALDHSIETVRKELPKLDDARMQQNWSGLSNGKPVMTMPKVALIRAIMLNHWIQHRGQLGVYLRLLGAKVPASYGPSGDEM
jgi:uncharacterized damage-inducible protein DinB